MFRSLLRRKQKGDKLSRKTRIAKRPVQFQFQPCAESARLSCQLVTGTAVASHRSTRDFKNKTPTNASHLDIAVNVRGAQLFARSGDSSKDRQASPAGRRRNEEGGDVGLRGNFTGRRRGNCRRRWGGSLFSDVAQYKTLHLTALPMAKITPWMRWWTRLKIRRAEVGRLEHLTAGLLWYLCCHGIR